MDPYEYSIPGEPCKDYSWPWWTVSSLNDNPDGSAYPVSGDDIALYRGGIVR